MADLTALSDKLGGLDSAKAAGIITIGALAVLVLIRKGFKGVTLHVGD